MDNFHKHCTQIAPVPAQAPGGLHVWWKRTVSTSRCSAMGAGNLRVSPSYYIPFQTISALLSRTCAEPMTANKLKEKAQLRQAQLFHQRHTRVLLQSSPLPTPPQPYGHKLLRDGEEKRSEDRLRTRHKQMQEMHPQQLPPDLRAPSLSAQQTRNAPCLVLISSPRNLC